MSTILKALRRLEEDKARDGSPRPLREEVASGPGEGPRRRWTALLPVVALAVGASLGASAWWFWPYEFHGDAAAPSAPAPTAAAPTPAAPQVAAAPAPPAPVAAAPAPEPPAAESVTPGEVNPDADPDTQIQEMVATLQNTPQDSPPDEVQPDDAYASEVEVVDRPAPSPRIEPVAPPPPVARRNDPITNPPPPGAEPPSLAPPRRVGPPPHIDENASFDGEDAAPVKPHSRSQFEPKSMVEPDPMPVPRPSAPARTASAPKPTATRPPAPALPTISDLYVTRTQWHPEHARRSADVTIGGQDRSVHEGDVVGEYVVNEIKPSGVVLSRDGQNVEQKIGKPPKEARSEP